MWLGGKLAPGFPFFGGGIDGDWDWDWDGDFWDGVMGNGEWGMGFMDIERFVVRV